jgi:hypothetical protein
VVDLPSVAPSAWVEYMTAKYDEIGLQLEAETADTILVSTGGHPDDTALLCNETYLAFLETRRRGASASSVSPAYARASVPKVVRQLAPAFGQLLERIGAVARGREVLAAIAVGSPPYKVAHANSVRRALHHLVRLGVVRHTGRGVYDFTEPLFAAYLRMLSADTL